MILRNHNWCVTFFIYFLQLLKMSYHFIFWAYMSFPLYILNSDLKSKVWILSGATSKWCICELYTFLLTSLSCWNMWLLFRIKEWTKVECRNFLYQKCNLFVTVVRIFRHLLLFTYKVGKSYWPIWCEWVTFTSSLYVITIWILFIFLYFRK